VAAAAEPPPPLTSASNSAAARSANPWAESGSEGATEADDDPFGEPAASPPLEKLPLDAQKVKEMFPDLPTPAILAALQKLPVAIVIERALGGQIDLAAVPSAVAPPRPPPSSGASGRHVSGAVVRVGACGGKFPQEAYPAHMLPRDLAALQGLYPTAPTSVLQAELQVTGSLAAAQAALLNDQVPVNIDIFPLPKVPHSLTPLYYYFFL
jgi:hypothetical protein